MIREFDSGYWHEKEIESGGGHDWSSHPHGVLTLVVDGMLHETFADVEHDCESLYVHWKPPGVLHETRTGRRGVHMLLLALQPFLVANSALARHRAPVVLPLGPSSVRALELLGNMEGLSRSAALSRVTGLVSEVLADAGREADPQGAPQWLRDACSWGRRRAVHRPSLATVAAVADVHPGSLSRAYRRHCGGSFARFLRRERLRRAIESVARRNASLAEIALDCGFADQSHLNRVFVRETGSTPGRFRDLLGQIAG